LVEVEVEEEEEEEEEKEEKWEIRQPLSLPTGRQ